MTLSARWTNLAFMVLLILIDGLAYPVFDRLLAAGRLPNLQRILLEDHSGIFGPALSSFPSTTAPALGEVFTGCYADRHRKNPRKIHAFDRETGTALRYEFVPQAWQGETDDLIDLANRSGAETLSFFKGEIGADRSYRSELLYSLDAITDFSSLSIFNYDGSSMAELARTLQREGARYDLVFLYLTTVDLNGHFHGPEDRRCLQAVEEIDRGLGHLFGVMGEIPVADGNLLENTDFVLFADHGMITSGHFVDLTGALQGFGLAAADLARVSTIFRSALRNRWWDDFDILVVPSGSSVCEIYVRSQRADGPRPWHDHPAYQELRSYPGRGDPLLRVDLLRVLQAHCGLDLIATPEEPGVTRLLSPGRGEARILSRGRFTAEGSFAYQILPSTPRGEDPLGYLGDGVPQALLLPPEIEPSVALRRADLDPYFHPLERWLELTWQASRPCGPPLIPKAFAPHPTRSEILLTSRRGFGFMKLAKGDHGDLSRDSMLVPVVLAGPSFNPRAALGRLRLVDLFPLLLDLLGIPQELRPAVMDARARPDLLRRPDRVDLTAIR